MFLRGCEAVEPSISGFFKLQKIRTDKNIVLGLLVFIPNRSTSSFDL